MLSISMQINMKIIIVITQTVVNFGDRENISFEANLIYLLKSIIRRNF